MKRRRRAKAAPSDGELLRGLPARDRSLIFVLALVCGGLGLALHPPLMAGFAFVLAAGALTTAAVDLRFLLIPDRLSLALFVAGLIAQTALGYSETGDPWFGDLWAERLALAAMGAAAGALAIGGLRLLWLRWKGVEAIGFGDVKLAGALGAWLGPVDLFAALFVAACAGLLLHGIAGPRRDPHLPFGAVFAPAAWLIFVLGPVFGLG